MAPTLILTRPEPRSIAFAEKITAALDMPIDVIISPLLKIVPSQVDTPLEDVKGYVFTSANGVAQTARLGLDTALTAWCVGQTTADAARALGFNVKVGPGNADDLRNMILAAAPEGPLAHIRGQHARGNISTTLSDAGLSCRAVVAYGQEALPLTSEATKLLSDGGTIVLPLFSPRTADICTSAVGQGKGPHVIAISSAVAKAAQRMQPQSLTTCEKPTGLHMIAATLDCLKNMTKDHH